MSRGLGYTDSELEALLDIVEEVLPRSPNEWEAISRRHIENFPGRTQDSIRRKFNSLANHKKPTGDPNCPPTVRRAKRIFALIRERMDISDGEDDNESDEVAPAVLTEDGVGIDGETPPSNEGDGEHEAVQEPTQESPPGVPSLPPLLPLRESSRLDVPQRPSVEGLRIRTPRRNVTSSSSTHSVNFPEIFQFMLMRADEENRLERRRQEERELAENMRRREREEAEERYRREREEVEERREQRMMNMMQMFVTSITEAGRKRKRHDDDSNES